jgi:tetratricopeptide (TPR) repeat protein
MSGRAFVSRFSPNRTDPEVLEAIFVQRHKLAEVWLERLRDSVLTDVKHHLLAVGPRGCGKSHLVALLVHRLRKDPTVAERVRLAWLPEDETTPSFWKFLLRILRALNAEYGDEFPPPPRDQLDNAPDDRRSAVLTDYLLKKLDGRTLLVVVENLDEVMRGLKTEGQRRWRAFLQEHPVAATLATSQRLSEAVSNRDRPFFNFFQIEHLHPLTADEALALLRKIAEHTGKPDLATFLQTAVGRARVRAIRHLAGGSHRVFIILSEFASRENLYDLVTAFEELLDELTPYYQERLRWLPDQQREIVEFLCRQPRTVPVKEIAADLFLTEQAAAAQLKQLKDKGYVMAGTVGRESRYELAEPMMRLCVEVKDPQREPIRLIVDFLRVWYDRSQFRNLFAMFDRDSDTATYVDAVLRANEHDSADLLKTMLTQDWEAAKASGDLDRVRNVARDIIDSSDSANWCFVLGYELDELDLGTEALQALHRSTVLDPSNASAWLAKGLVLNKLKRFAEAVETFNQASKFDGYETIGLYGMGAALSELGDHEQGLAVIDRALQLDPEVTTGWVLRGMVLRELERLPVALEAFGRATQIDAGNAEAWRLKGQTLDLLDRDMDAIEAFDRAIALEPDDYSSWERKGHILVTLERFEEAADAFQTATELDPTHGGVWGGLGMALLTLGHLQEASQAMERATELDPDVFVLWAVKGIVFNHLGRDEVALKAFDRAIELKPDEKSAWLCRGGSRVNLGDKLGGLEDIRHALKLDPGFHEAAELLARLLAREDNWDEVWEVLAGPFRQARAKPPERQDRSELPSFLAAVLSCTPDRHVLVERVRQVVGIYAHWRALAYLGDALVQSLKELDHDEGEEALDDWAVAWREETEQYSELTLAVRLFGVGVRYVQTKDERVLLDLVQEERSILRDLFGLDNRADEAGTSTDQSR